MQALKATQRISLHHRSTTFKYLDAINILIGFTSVQWKNFASFPFLLCQINKSQVKRNRVLTILFHFTRVYLFISGRYEEQFIERRRLQLQSFVSRVSNHPILSRSDVWMHFLTCTDAKRWKTGKRKAEKDEVIGAAIFGVVQVPEKSLDPLQL